MFGGVPHDIQSTLAHLNEKERNCARPGSTAPTPRRATNGAGFGHKKAPTLPACSVISSMSPRASMAAEGIFFFLRFGWVLGQLFRSKKKSRYFPRF